MALVRVYNGPDGKSHFEDLDLPFVPQDTTSVGRLNPVNQRSPVFIVPEKIQGMFFETQSESYKEWHLNRQRHYLFLIDGDGGLTDDLWVSDGERRQFGRGDVLLLEDMEGEGHISMLPDGHKRLWCAVMLAD